MKKSIYNIRKMDCPSEEQLIRMKLAGLEQIKQLDFDIANRRLKIYHTDDDTLITNAIDTLNLDSTLLASEHTSEHVETNSDSQQSKLLWQVLIVNFSFFLIEIITGFISNSMGLVADSLDMFADSIVYGLALFAVGSTASRKGSVAKISGYFQIGLAVLGLIEVLRRFVDSDHIPAYGTMIIVSLFALVGNSLCLYLLQKSKSKEAHMEASMIFTSNDIVINMGVIIAGILVYFTNSMVPDLIIGVCVFFIVARGALKILQL
ncbi:MULTISPECIES: cation transporter [Flavobacterium]|nr:MULTISPECIES: cation diffusion facilitator family transporter [Flavobacterium]SHF92188.1 Cation efflux family protein [Flavobacterium frigidimaris]MBZ4035298.1 cation diffusion facilitator family transporter [Flavobacterium potami]MDP5199033.1 cation diffusion facilitator family transporter [Flavobacterium sp. DG2-3]OXA74433.1 cation transporter [Flavobacterium aquidurense]OXE98436.1 cation transporter [Flavobacterium johnsoniae UW101]